MSAFEKLFSDSSRTNGTISIKKLNGETHAAKVPGATGLDDQAFVDNAAGSSFSKSRKEVNARGEVVAKKLTVKADDVSPSEAKAAVADLLGYPLVPKAVKDRSKSVTAEPSLNAAPAADGAVPPK